MLVQRINADNGEVLSTSDKEINTSLISTPEADSTAPADDKDDESKQERKEREKLDNIKDEGEAFSRNMRFRKIFYTNNGVIVLAEKYHTYTYSSQTYSPGLNGAPGYWRSTSYRVFECGDIMMCKIDLAGNINWLQVLPKQQREVVQTGYSSGLSVWSYSSFFDTYNIPFYAGFGALQNLENINIFFNDNPKNDGVLQPGQSVKIANRFGKSDCFAIALNTETGKYTRQLLFHNNDVPTAMPRFGSTINKDMYIIGKEDKIFGKTKIALAKISVAN